MIPAEKGNRVLEPHPIDMPVSTGQFNRQLSFQRWFPFKEAFAPQFVANVIQRQSRASGVVLDPFAGSGTTALTAQYLGWKPCTIEVNPFLADLVEAKLTRYDPMRLAKTWRGLRKNVAAQRVSLKTVYSEAPPTLCEPGVDGRWVFAATVLRRITAYRLCIEALPDPEHRRFFRVLLGATLIPLSNVVISGKGRRYRRGWELLQRTASDVDHMMDDSVERALADVAHDERKEWNYQVMRGDARIATASAPPIHLAIFSPPYPNSFDYTDIYNIELWVLGYLKSADDNRALRRATVHSHVQLVREPSHAPACVELADCLEALKNARSRLWSKHIPEMVGSYFADLSRVMQMVGRKLRPGGEAVVVVGDSRYDTVYVDVASILTDIAKAHGFSLRNRESIRAMRVSPQQGGQHGLTETALTFVRDEVPHRGG